MGKTEKYLVVIAGPTAAGKTKLAIQLARHFNTEIISADSRQIYSEMNIGTAKPSQEQLKLVTHHMVGNKKTDELFGAGHFAKETLVILADLFKRHNIIVLVGGSGLYIDALLNGVDEFEPVPRELREQLNRAYADNGINCLREEVKKHDPAYFSGRDINNPQRLIRALEVSLHTGKPYSDFLKKKKNERDFEPIKLLITPPREELYKRINQRTEDMMAAGLLEEAKELFNRRHLNALKTVGYKELFEFLEGKTTLSEAVNKIKQHTRNYAKRQLTWFRNRDNFTEFGPGEAGKIISYIEEIIK